jgi:hypothetical protein
MSNINPYNIDGTYPVAGQDNDSQGFRDNFTNIRNNFSYAATEIADLQSKSITTSALTGGTLTNNMSYNQLQNAQLYSPSYTLLNLGTVTGATALDYSQGAVQKATTSGSITLSFTNWPTTGQYGSLKLWVYISSTAHTITVPTTLLGLNDVAGIVQTSGVITFDAIGHYVFEFFTIDAGTTIFINDVTRNHASLRDPNMFFDDAVANTMFIGFGTNATVLNYAIASDANRNVLAGLGSFSSISVGNLSQANLLYSTLDTGPLAGHNITSARGNLQTGTYTPVSGGDYLGYVNAVTLTGNGSGNAFQQVSSINFYATGSNVTYGLGGNIAFYTGKDGDVATTHTTYQAIGIENDQSTRVFGNLLVAASTSASQSSYKPASSSAAGVPGQMAWDSTYLYICVSSNSWRRVALGSAY